MPKFYITTAIPYVNAKPHIGHALEFVECDVIARYHRLKGEDTALLSGADENALKNVQAAEAAEIPIQTFVDQNADSFVELAKAYNVQIDFFQKGSDQKTHFPASQTLWEKCKAAGDIYQKEYEGLYCVGCETFYTEDELNENGECFLHPGKPLQSVKETNYFFKLSRYQDQLIKLISENTYAVYPEARKNEVLGFLKEPLLDISISRSNERARNWGVPVPGDDSQRMYVWFDALNIYQSGVGFGWDEALYKRWWPADVHVIGKDILRFHAVYWPAFLMSAQLPLPKQLFVHGFVTSEGQKMSKTLGNVIDPHDFLKEYGLDAVRYYLLREIPAGNDGDISHDRFKELYNADLANGIGNLVSRVVALIQKNCDGVVPTIDKDPDAHPLRVNPDIHNWKKSWADIDELVPQFRFNEALESILKFVNAANKYLNETEPWKLVSSDRKEFEWVMYGLLDGLHQLSWQLYPFLPDTAISLAHRLGIEKLLVDQPHYDDSWTNITPGTKIEAGEPLFPRIGSKLQ